MEIRYSNNKLFEEYVERLEKVSALNSAAALLQWDEETYMPLAGAAGRARQLATLHQLSHEQFTSEEFGSLLSSLAKESLTPFEEKNVSLTQYDFERETKLSSAFVHRLSRKISEAYHAWTAARKENNFRVFAPHLKAVVELKREEAEMRGYMAHPYNAMLDAYERDLSVSALDDLFSKLKTNLEQLISKTKHYHWPQAEILSGTFNKDDQWRWGMFLLSRLGFDFTRGRQDISIHPFSTQIGPGDTRITTRIDERDLMNMTFSTIHECGHALYEQGLLENVSALPAGTYTSLSIHESQSRLWENCVGRNFMFWVHFFPELQKHFPSFGQTDVLSFSKAINKIQPSLIRTEADEITYHYHVMVRYEIEKMLFEKSISVDDIPAVWKELYKAYLDVDVPDDNNGCLQDVHWSHGSFGYFPTYSLGSLYAAQFWEAAKRSVDNLETNLENGSTTELLHWLRENIHRHGRLYSTEALCIRVTGEPLNPSYFNTYYLHKLQKMFE